MATPYIFRAYFWPSCSIFEELARRAFFRMREKKAFFDFLKILLNAKSHEHADIKKHHLCAAVAM